MRNKTVNQGWILAVVLAFFVLALAGHGQDQAKPGTAAVVGSDGIQRIRIAGGSYYFDPSVIILKVNVPAELAVYVAAGHKPHAITIQSPEAGMNFSVKLGKDPKTIRFTPTKVGEYPFWCPEHFPLTKSHREHGMVGTIRVVE